MKWEISGAFFKRRDPPYPFQYMYTIPKYYHERLVHLKVTVFALKEAKEEGCCVSGNMRVVVEKGRRMKSCWHFWVGPSSHCVLTNIVPSYPATLHHSRQKNATHKFPQNSESHTEVCSAPSPYLTLLDEVSEVSEAKSLFFCFFRLDRSGPWEPRWTVMADTVGKMDARLCWK